MEKNLRQLLAGLKYEVIQGSEDREIMGVAYDSRKVEENFLFVCIKGEWFDHPAKKLTTIGITGTKGKTTTSYMIQSILNAAGHKCGLIGTIESITGKRVIPSENTTPESYLINE